MKKTLLSNSTGTGAWVTWHGGRATFLVAGNFSGGGSVKLQGKLPEGTAYDIEDASFDANGAMNLDLPPGEYRVVATTATAVYSDLVRIPGRRRPLGGGSAPAAPFTPAALPGLEWWLDAQDITTITKDGSNIISAWNDKSVNARHLDTIGVAAPTYNATGINGTPSVHFTRASSQSISTGLDFALNEWTMILLCQVTSKPAVTHAVLGDHTAASVPLALGSAGTGNTSEPYDGANYADFSDNYSTATPLLYVLKSTASPASAVMSRNGVNLTRSGSVGTSWTMEFGALGARRVSSPIAGWYFDGDIGDLIICSGTLSDADIAKAVAFINAKRGL